MAVEIGGSKLSLGNTMLVVMDKLRVATENLLRGSFTELLTVGKLAVNYGLYDLLSICSVDALQIFIANAKERQSISVYKYESEE